MIISPCLSICKTDPITGYCYGCGRTNKEKKIWKDPNTKDLWKQNNLTQLFNRLTGWQLQSFKESYDHKVKNGKPLNNKIIDSLLISGQDNVFHYLKDKNTKGIAYFSINGNLNIEYLDSDNVLVSLSYELQ